MMEGEEALEKVKRENAIRDVLCRKIMKIERRLRRKVLEDPGSRPPAPPPVIEGNPIRGQGCHCGEHGSSRRRSENPQEGPESGSTASSPVERPP